jgi:hypothetical protein
MPGAYFAGFTLLLVALDRLLVPDLRLVGVVAELPPGAALPQEVPALIELDLEGAIALVVLGRAVRMLVQPMLLFHEVLDAMK